MSTAIHRYMNSEEEIKYNADIQLMKCKQKLKRHVFRNLLQISIKNVQRLNKKDDGDILFQENIVMMLDINQLRIVGH